MDINAIDKYIGKIFKAFNQPLWSGLATSGSITITGINKYCVLAIETAVGTGIGVVGSDGKVKFTTSMLASGSDKSQFIATIEATVSNNTFVINDSKYKNHQSNDVHGGNGPVEIKKIIGLIPNMWGGTLKKVFSNGLRGYCYA